MKRATKIVGTADTKTTPRTIKPTGFTVASSCRKNLFNERGIILKVRRPAIEFSGACLRLKQPPLQNPERTGAPGRAARLGWWMRRDATLLNAPSGSWGMVQVPPTSEHVIVSLNTPSGSWGIVQVLPIQSTRLDLKYPPASAGRYCTTSEFPHRLGSDGMLPLRLNL